jgi:beta-glucosidase
MNGNAKNGGVEMGGKNDYQPSFTIAPLDGLRARFGDGAHVIYRRGISSVSNMSTGGFAAAVSAAKAADVTVVVVGLDGDEEGEGRDRANTTLVGLQSQLVQVLMHAVGPERLVVVLVNGGSISPDWVKAHCPTVVEAMEGGQSGGQALAEVLAGDVSPSGVLPYTMYPAIYLEQVSYRIHRTHLLESTGVLLISHASPPFLSASRAVAQ